MNADELVLAYREALTNMATAKARLSLAEDKLKIVMAERVNSMDAPISKAEYAARASEEYQKAVTSLYGARSEAEAAIAEVEYLRVRWETWRTKMSMAKTVRQTNG